MKKAMLLPVILTASWGLYIGQEKTEEKLKQQLEDILKRLSNADIKVRQDAKKDLDKFIDSEARVELVKKQTLTAWKDVTDAVKASIKSFKLRTYGLIAFVRERHIWVMNGDGSDQERLTPVETLVSLPTFSPDGKKIVYSSGPYDSVSKEWKYDSSTCKWIGRQIYIIDVETKVEKKLTCTWDSCDPAFSPDGKKIVFAQKYLNSETNQQESQIYEMDLEGKNIKQLTSGAAISTSPAYRFDGKKIAFMSDGNVYVVDSDGKNVKQITSDAAQDNLYFNPGFTKEGGVLVFVDTGSGLKVRTADVDGKNSKTIDSEAEYWKLISPDGKYVIMTAFNGVTNKEEIHIMDIETKTKKLVAEGSRPNWFHSSRLTTGLN